MPGTKIVKPRGNVETFSQRITSNNSKCIINYIFFPFFLFFSFFDLKKNHTKKVFFFFTSTQLTIGLTFALILTVNRIK